MGVTPRHDDDDDDDDDKHDDDHHRDHDYDYGTNQGSYSSHNIGSFAFSGRRSSPLQTSLTRLREVEAAIASAPITGH